MCKCIKKGKVVVFPTDTLYGLITDARNQNAVKKLFKIKKRKSKKPIPIFVKDIKMARGLAQINKKQENFLKKFWPGKITVIFKKRGLKVYGVNKRTIALRIPKNTLVNKLLKGTDRPLTGTSANLSGKPATNQIKDILKQFRDQKFQPDLIINAGNLKRSKPSTIIDLIGQKPKILRK